MMSDQGDRDDDRQASSGEEEAEIESPVSSFNRRRSVRVQTELSVRATRGKETIYTVAVDLSQGGMFIHELLPFSVGTKLELSFLLPGVSRTVQCHGEVVQARNDFREGFPDAAIGNGLRFLDLDPEDRLAIVRYLKERLV
jgi:uncharacterized protein (TIGR02266 family)